MFALSHESNILSFFPLEHLEKLSSQKETTAEQRAEYESVVNKIDDYGQEDLGRVMKKYNVKSSAGNDITDPKPFNLMFGTQIGPTGQLQGYLRPETAQGMFVNFKYLLEYNNGKMVRKLISWSPNINSVFFLEHDSLAIRRRPDWPLLPQRNFSEAGSAPCEGVYDGGGGALCPPPEEAARQVCQGG